MTWNHTTSTDDVLHTCTMDVFGDGTPAGKPETSMAVSRGQRPQERTEDH